MRGLIGVLCIALLAGCAEKMKIAAKHMTEEYATLRFEAPDLDGYVTIPGINYKAVAVKLSMFPGCEKPRDARDLKPIGEATLTPSTSGQVKRIPVGKEMAVYVQSVEYVVGHKVTCGMAARFLPEADNGYVLRFAPNPTWGWGIKCDMELFIRQEGKEVPLQSARFATLDEYGLNLCKAAVRAPQ